MPIFASWTLHNMFRSAARAGGRNSAAGDDGGVAVHQFFVADRDEPAAWAG